ncbi:MAG: UDP-N-acetylmuramoyl-L-alanine--D-glutamate ligase, partial [Oscillospiraceae bacterium]
ALTILHAETMEQAVKIMYDNTGKGDIVSLSPASASFDLYPNFEERGLHFKALVNAL